MKKTAEEYLDEYIKQRNLSPHKLFGFSEMADFAEDFAAQEVAERDKKILQYIDVCMDEDHTNGFYSGLMAIKGYIEKQP